MGGYTFRTAHLMRCRSRVPPHPTLARTASPSQPRLASTVSTTSSGTNTMARRRMLSIRVSPFTPLRHAMSPALVAQTPDYTRCPQPGRPDWCTRSHVRAQSALSLLGDGVSRAPPATNPRSPAAGSGRVVMCHDVVQRLVEIVMARHYTPPWLKPTTATLSRQLRGTYYQAMRCEVMMYSDIVHVFVVSERL